MPISNYGDLKTQVAAVLHDTTLTDQMDLFLTLTEARLNYGSLEQGFDIPPLRISAMQAEADLLITGRTASAPPGYLEALRLYLEGVPSRLLRKTSPVAIQGGGLSVTGPPTHFAEEAGGFVFGPSPDTTYTGKLLYFKAIEGLVEDTDTNTILTTTPAVYLAGMLAEAWHFVQDDAQAERWFAKFRGAIEALNEQEKARVASGSVVRGLPEVVA